MPTSVHVGKSIRTEFIRQRLGDAEAERFFVKVFGSLLMPQRVPAETLQKTLDIVEGRANGHAAHLIPLAFRAWFAEQPRARARFVAFLKQRILEAAAPASNGHENGDKPTAKVAKVTTRYKKHAAWKKRK